MAACPQSTSISTAELQELLVCDICAETYDNEAHRAKFLDCHHTFCSECLDLLARQRQEDSNTILCPNCRHPTHLPENGVHGLRINFYIEKVKACSDANQQTKDDLKTDCCYKHRNQPLAFFCETCGTAICRDCTVFDHDKTSGHDVVNFADAVTSQRDELQDRINISRVIRTKVHDVVHQIESEMDKLLVCTDSAMEDLRSVIHSAHQQLQQCEHDVTNVLFQEYEGQQHTLLDDKLKFHQAGTLLDKYVCHSDALMKTCDLNEMSVMTGKLNNAAEMAKSQFALFYARKECLTSGMITSGASLNESLCHLKNNCLKSVLPTKVLVKNCEITTGFKSSLTVELLNDDNNRVPMAACFLIIAIRDPRGNELPVALNTTHPESVVTFTPEKSGRHDISVMYLGQKLMGKQTHISVMSNDPVLKIGGLGDGNGAFNSPRAIAIDNNNCLYVADTGNGLIQKFSADGEFLSQFPVSTINKDHAAFSVALDLNKGLIICTEILIENNAAVKGNTVLLFNLEGELQHSYTINDTSCPLTITTNGRGNALISDTVEKCVLEVEKTGNVLRRIGDFKYPGYICTSDDGSIIVSDVFGHCIFIFNPGGSEHQFGSFGTGKGQLKKPFGVATDGEYILVAEGTNNRVQVFRCDGTPVHVIESNGDPLNQPRGLAITKDGHVYVVDRENHCVKKYKYRTMPW